MELDQKIKLNDQLSLKDEDKYLKVIESIVVTEIKDREREALLAIRKEIIRK